VEKGVGEGGKCGLAGYSWGRVCGASALVRASSAAMLNLGLDSKYANSRALASADHCPAGIRCRCARWARIRTTRKEAWPIHSPFTTRSRLSYP
jgi:hypothetical protein